MKRNNEYLSRRFGNVADRFRDMRNERDHQRQQDFRDWEVEQRHNFRHWGPDLDRGFHDRGYPEHHNRAQRSRPHPENEYQRHYPSSRQDARMDRSRHPEEREMWRPENSGRIGHMEQYAHLNRLVGGRDFGSDYRRMLKAMDDYWQGGMDDQPDYGSYYEERGTAFRPMPSQEQRSMHRRKEYGQEAWNKASGHRNSRGRR